MLRLLLKLREALRPADDATAKRLRRRQAVVSSLTGRLSLQITTLLVVGYFWFLALPFRGLGRGTYIDENALQPSQVNTYWDWNDVNAADKYLERVEFLRDSNATSQQRAHFFKDEFSKLGLLSATQDYSFHAISSSQGNAGTNAYAVLASPRGPRNEAMVISASWISRSGEGEGTLNLRGVSTVLALARFLKKYSLWAKDIVFVISDGYLDGMHAWLNVYHGSLQPNLHADPLEYTSGVIWTALNIDYPGHSFSHLGLFFEGPNGRLPNQDLLNSVQRIARYTGQVPVTLYDHLDWRDPLSHQRDLPFLPSSLAKIPEIRDFVDRARNIIRQVGYQSRGKASGVHGLYHKFRIDAVTLFAVPATGPHGFYAIGRIVESSLRTMNNLLERLHASFFFYILTGPDQFMKIGSYLPSVILISVAMMFRGLRCWANARLLLPEQNVEGSPDKRSPVPMQTAQTRPVLAALSIMAFTHLLGFILFFVLNKSWYLSAQEVNAPLVASFFSVGPLAALVFHRPPKGTAPLWRVLQATNLCFASTVISAITILNFSLAALLATTLSFPLLLSSPARSRPVSWFKYSLYCFLALGWIFLHQQVRETIWQWEILSVWFGPFVCLIYTPLVLQAAIVCVLPPT